MSRSIDALVAEHVMGWENVQAFPIKKPGADWFGYRGKQPAELIPSYSTDIKAAWEVVDWFLSYQMQFTLDFDDEWYVDLICSTDDGERGIEIYAETAPMAICLAALKSKGIEYEEN